MKKKSLLVTILLLLIAVFAFSFTACDKEVKMLQNDFGAVAEGGGFKEGSLLITNEIKADSAEAKEALSVIADQSYDKECACGAKQYKGAHIDSNANGSCDVCGYVITESNDGALIGIVIGSVAVVGVGGFALFWFVIKKKYSRRNKH